METCPSSSERASFENDSVLHDQDTDASMYNSSNSAKQKAKGKTSKSSVEFASSGVSTPQVNTQGRKSVGKPDPSSKSNRESFSGEAAFPAGDNKKGHTRLKVKLFSKHFFLSPCIS